jgi:UDP-N-acetyl-2-amino-2-deoxyglucuronate dehydrogenase
LKKEKVRFAVLGYGFSGKRHCSHLVNMPEAELVAVADSDFLRQEEARVALGCAVYADLAVMLAEHPEIEVVNICTPNGLHTEHAIYALQNERHVVLEKPMGLTVESCRATLSQAQSVNREVFCVLQNRYSPPVMWLREILQDNRLGRVFFVGMNCFWNRDEFYYLQSPWRGTLSIDGGPLYTQFSHFVDILAWLFGDIHNVQAIYSRARSYSPTEFEDTGAITFSLENGGLGSFNYSTAVARKNFESSITIISEKGAVKIGGQYMNEVLHCDIKDYEFHALPACNEPNDYGFYQGSANNFNLMLKNIVLALRGGVSQISNGGEGLQGVKLIEKMYQPRARFLKDWNLPSKTQSKHFSHFVAGL